MEPLRNASDLRLDSHDKQIELMYLLRERMTLLQSHIELAQTQLSSMRSGKASRDLYSRVFLPLRDELEGTTRQYEAVVTRQAQPDRKSQRDLGVPAKRHRHFVRPRLVHRSAHLPA